MEHRPGDAFPRPRRDGDDLDRAGCQRDDRPLLVQPVAPADVADVLAEVAIGQLQGRCPDLAGPEPQDLVDLASRTRGAHGTSIRPVPTWSGVFGFDMAGEVLLPEPDARIAPTTFDDWLAGETRS